MASNDSKTTSKKKHDLAQEKASGAAGALSAKLSGPLAPLEKSLNDIFGEKAPYKLPKSAKDGLVKIAPWLSLAGGVLGLLAAIGFWQAAHRVNEWVDYANQLSTSLGGPSQSVAKLGIAFWLSLIMLIVFSVLAFLAFPGLKARKKVGWNLMFYSAIANFLYGVVSIFYSGAGFGSFIATALGTVIGLYLLFQVRSHYK